MKAFYRALIYGVSRLPFTILYLLADILFVVLYYVVKYRKNVVWQNLKNSFPGKTDLELKTIQRNFYRHLSDLALETLKSLTITEKELEKRSKIIESESKRHYFENEKGCIVMTAHMGSWEWSGLAVGAKTKNKPFQVVYLKIKNDFFNDLMFRLRSRLGNRPVKMENCFRQAIQYPNMVSCFLADQTPQSHKIGYWGNFMNRQTAFYNGPEKMAQKLKHNVYFATTKKVKRGYYEIHFELITDKPELTSEGEIMKMYVQKLEQSIFEQPHIWLWSHRRWKHKPPQDIS